MVIGAVWAGSQIDRNFSLFVPNRYYGAGNRGAGAGTGIFLIDATHNGDISSNNRHFYIPGLVFNHMLDEQSSLGVAVYDNGGQNTKFNGGTTTFSQNLPLGLTVSTRWAACRRRFNPTGGLSYQFSHALMLDLAYASGHSVTGKNPLSNAPGTVTVGQNGNLVSPKFDAGADHNDQDICINLREFEATLGVSYHFN